MSTSPFVDSRRSSMDSDVAPARVLRMVGKAKTVLAIGVGPGTRHLSGTLGCNVAALDSDPTALEKLSHPATASA